MQSFKDSSAEVIKGKYCDTEIPVWLSSPTRLVFCYRKGGDLKSVIKFFITTEPDPPNSKLCVHHSTRPSAQLSAGWDYLSEKSLLTISGKWWLV